MALDADLLTGRDWQQRLDELAGRHRVPGFQVGLLSADGDVRVLASGRTGAETGVAATPDTLFHYGSITKVWTTTLVMQLVDEGMLTLDTKVVDVLPGFTLADPGHAEAITVRHLLVHTSGIDGDVFTDTGDGDDALEKYVAHLATAVSVTEPGGPLSYCNAGFVVAGRIVEVLRGRTWDEVLAERICRPLGLTRVLTRPNNAPLFRTAVGHLRDPETDQLKPTPRWQLPRSVGPAGTITGDSADLLRFLAAHLRDGVGLNGERILSAESTRFMREQQVDLSAHLSTLSGWALGWSLSDWGGVAEVGHNGNTSGQVAQMHTFPELGLAMCVLTNSDSGPALADDIEAELGKELGLTPTTPREDPDAAEADLKAVAGTYETTLVRCELALEDDGLVLHLSEKGTASGSASPEPSPVTPLSRNRFAFDRNGARREFAHLTHNGKQYVFAGRLFEPTN